MPSVQNSNHSSDLVLVPPSHHGVVETTSIFAWKQDNMVLVKVKPGCIGLAEAQESLSVFWSVAGQRVLPLLVDITNCESVSRPARQAFMTGSRGRVRALAFVTGTGFGTVIANFFYALNPTDYAIKMFVDFSSARSWLQKHSVQ